MNGLEIVEYAIAEDEYYKALLEYIEKKLNKLGNLLDGYEQENGEVFTINGDSFFEYHHEKNGNDITLRFLAADEKDQAIQAEFHGTTRKIFINEVGKLVIKEDSEIKPTQLTTDRIQVKLGILSSINKALDELLPYLDKKKREFEGWIKTMDNTWERDWSGVKI